MRSLLKTCLSSLLFAGLLLANPLQAADHPAQTLVEDSTNQALEVLRKEGDRLESDPVYLRQKVDELVVPHVDFNSMTKLAIGKSWRQADNDQKITLVEEFKNLLMNTYSNALTQYKGETLVFEPYRPGRRDDRATVRSTFKQSGAGGDVPVIFKLRSVDDGWKIYDIDVNNISLVTSYRTAFANEINKGGVEGLIETLKERNASGRQSG